MNQPLQISDCLVELRKLQLQENYNSELVPILLDLFSVCFSSVSRSSVFLDKFSSFHAVKRTGPKYIFISLEV